MCRDNKSHGFRYTSITPTPLRWELWDEASTCNELVMEMAEKRENLSYIDCTTVLLDEDGLPRSDFRRSDGLHFNEEGYRLWASAIRPVLLADFYEGGVEE